LWPFVHDRFHRYIGADVVRYEGMPTEAEFKHVDLDSGRVGLPNDSADVVVAVETIEHLENPRAFMRELVRLAKPSGWIIVTTPNQLSLLSKVTLLIKNQFNAFQEAPGLYPAHLTALLESDLVRIATECGLTDVDTAFSHVGRMPLGHFHYPSWMSRRFPRLLSDNVLLIARKAGV
jgi:SAM-dependent methyltransferase